LTYELKFRSIQRFTLKRESEKRRDGQLTGRTSWGIVVHGTWDELASAPAHVTSRQWHTLALKAEGDRFSVALDGQPVLAATDATFRAPGTALCTKADSVTRRSPIAVRSSPAFVLTA
jgi:hypothetical protein